MDGFVDFLTMHRYFLGSLNSQTHLVASNIHHRDDDVLEVWRVLAVGNDLFVVDRMKAQALIAVQGRILTSNLVHFRDQANEVARGITIPMAERLSVLGDIIHHQTDQVTMMPLFYQGQAAVLGSTRIKGMTSAKVWNAHLWSVD